MGTDEDKMVRVREKPANSLYFGGACILPKQVQADDDERVGRIEKSRIEFGARAIVRHPLDLDDRMTGLRAGLFHEGGEVLLHDMIQEAADALGEARRIRKCFKSGVEHPSALKERRKPILDNFERCFDLSGPAPCVINHDFPANHSASPVVYCRGRYLGAAAGAGAGAAPGAVACGLRAGAGLVAGAATAGFGFTDGSSMVMAASGRRVQYWFL